LGGPELGAEDARRFAPSGSAVRAPPRDDGKPDQTRTEPRSVYGFSPGPIQEESIYRTGKGGWPS
jgi:hypothetical protein